MIQEVKALKNPLSQALGLLIKRYLSERNWDLKDFERETGIRPNYIRSILQGQTSLHISKAVILYDVFKKESLGKYPSVEGLINYLSLISILEARGNEKIAQYEEVCKILGYSITLEGKNKEYFKGLIEASLTLSKASEKYKALFYPFFSHDIYSKSTSDEVAEIIETRGLLIEVEDFLMNYESYGMNETVRHSIFFDKFFNDVASIYVDIFSTVKKSLSYLPIRIHMTELWKWEDQFCENFEELTIVFTGTLDNTSKENLEQYMYKYLWQKNFQQLNVIYCNLERSSDDLFKDFDKNLQLSYQKTSLPENWEEGMKKVNFFTTNKLTVKEQKLMESENDFYTAFWIFKVINSGEVAFVAKEIPGERNKIDAGKCLTVSETNSKLKIVDSLLKRVKKEKQVQNKQ
ncbi:MAG: helix-turn-helix transcriptional regulator [Chitinophagaceae bacterium]|nr:helix-turn-helix transcriptional regulator [Chitinophagaceae bacterium]